MSEKKGILYGVGVGPGDPELLTLKALRILKETDIIALPDKGTAYNIVKEHIGGKELMQCHTPMSKDREKLENNYKEIADNICSHLSEGKTVAFITLGDPTVYSTYVYIHKKVLDRGYTAQLIPGVTSFCAAASRLNVPLCERDERLLIVPASYDRDDALDINANKVFMKAGSAAQELKESLSQRGLLSKSMAVENCGMESEKVWQSLEEYEQSGYFTVIIVKDAGDVSQ